MKKSAMGKTPGAFFVAAIFAFTSIAATSCAKIPGTEHDCPPFGATETVTIRQVIDGDTVHLADGRKVRLIGINTAELGYDGAPDQPWAKTAQQALQQFLGNRALLLTDRDKKDNHGRTLAHLYNLQEESAEAYLLKQGLGWHVAIPPNLTQAECLAKAERLARDDNRALWGPNGTATTAADKVSTGGFQRVQGKVTGVTFGKRGWWIAMGDKVAAVIYPEHQHRFDTEAVKQLQGKEIIVHGWVYASRSKKYQPWRIRLETQFALQTP